MDDICVHVPASMRQEGRCNEQRSSSPEETMLAVRQGEELGQGKGALPQPQEKTAGMMHFGPQTVPQVILGKEIAVGGPQVIDEKVKVDGRKKKKKKSDPIIFKQEESWMQWDQAQGEIL